MRIYLERCVWEGSGRQVANKVRRVEWNLIVMNSPSPCSFRLMRGIDAVSGRTFLCSRAMICRAREKRINVKTVRTQHEHETNCYFLSTRPQSNA